MVNGEPFMGKVRAILLLFIASIVTMGCSRVGFQSVPKQTCSSSNMSADTACSVQGQNLQYSFTFQTGQVDILFVDDNSGSMAHWQAQMAAGFSSLLSQISNLNYQIGITTTDISTTVNPVTGQVNPPDQANGNGAFQDGKLLQYTDTSGNLATDVNGNPIYYISPSTPNNQDLFAGTIQREETLYCEENGFQPAFCPSDVARGIYAVNDAITNYQDSNHSGFFRTGAPLALVMLNDSDECETGVSAADCGSDYVNDEPQTLIQNMNSTFPTKALSVYSIVVPNQQCVQDDTFTYPSGITTYGIIGTTYIALSDATSFMGLGNIVPGTVGNICSTNYSSQLATIGSMVAQNNNNSPIQLACNPQNLSISTQPASATAQLTYNVDSQNRLTFSNVPNGLTVTVSYQCSMY